MFLPFFLGLKAAKIPVSLREYLSLLEGMEAGLVTYDVEGFYYLARAALVKDEKHIDRFDQVFGQVFKGLEKAGPSPLDPANIPEEWLRKLMERNLTDEEKRLIESLGGFEKLMETLKERIEEQKGRHQGGSKWIGTAGTSPFGAHGYNPEGVRIGQAQGRNKSAVKVWDQRSFKNFDDSVQLGTRNIKLALKRLRRWVREGADEEFDLPGTIHATAEHGYLDVRTRPERRNAIKLLMFFDVGGSMDEHIKVVEELFSAARTEFKRLEYFYFHNCLYEKVWKDNRRRHSDPTPTLDVLHKYGPDYKTIFVGDAAMSLYEITQAGGSVEHWNEEPGAVWMARALRQWPNAVWINPTAEKHWQYLHSVAMLRDMFSDRMYPLTLAGLDKATKQLTRKH